MDTIEEKQKYILVNINGLDKWSMNQDELLGRTFTLCDNHEIERSMFGFDFVKGWFHLENPPEDTVTRYAVDWKFFFIGVQMQTVEENVKHNGIMVVAS